MAKLTDQEVIQYFQNRKQELTQELHKIETVLSTLTGDAAPKKRKYTRRQGAAAGRGRKPKTPTAQSAIETMAETPVKTNRARRKTTGAKAAGSKTVPPGKTAVKKGVKAPNSTPKALSRATSGAQPSSSSSGKYPAEGSWDSKIQYALGQIGSGKKEDITQFIAGKEPGASPEKIQKALTLRLAILAKAGKLKAEQAGDQQHYSLS